MKPDASKSLLEEALERYRKTKPDTGEGSITVNGKTWEGRANAPVKTIRKRTVKLVKRKPTILVGKPRHTKQTVYNSTAIRGWKVSGGLPSLGKRR